MVHTGESSYAYWGIEGTALAGEPSTDQNIPFNPMISFAPPKPKYADTEERTFDSLEPKYIWTNELTPGEGTLEMNFRDPFLLLSMFTHKTVSGTWVTGDGVLTGDFTDDDDVDTLFIQYHNNDDSGNNDDVDNLLLGGLPMRYAWVVEPGMLLKEVVDLKFLNFSRNTQAMSCSNDFHDQAWGTAIGGWANWDDTGLNGTGKRSVADMSFTWGGSAFNGLDVKSFEFGFDMGYESTQLYSSLSHTKYWRSPRNCTFSITGLLNDYSALDPGTNSLADYENLFSNRTSNTMIVYYDNTTGDEKYLQCTNMYLSPESDIIEIPEAGQPVEMTLVFKGGEEFAVSFEGTYDTLVDPSVLISTSA